MMAVLLQAQGQGQGSNPLGLILPFVLVLGIMWLLLIRPQRKRDRQRREMLERVKKNDKVVTVGGIHGTVRRVKDGEVVLLVDESNNTKLRMSLSAVSKIMSEEKEEGELSD